MNNKYCNSIVKIALTIIGAIMLIAVLGIFFRTVLPIAIFVAAALLIGRFVNELITKNKGGQ